MRQSFSHHKPEPPPFLPFLQIHRRLVSRFSASAHIVASSIQFATCQTSSHFFFWSLITFIAEHRESVYRVSFVSQLYRHGQRWETQGDNKWEVGVDSNLMMLHLLLCSCPICFTHTHIQIDYITFHFCATVQAPTPTPNPITVPPHVSLCGLQWSHDPRHGVRSPRQRELDHPGPNAIQIKECIQRKECHASLQRGAI